MTKRNFTSEYKAKIVLEILEGSTMASEIASRESISPKQLSAWKQEFLKQAHKAFATGKEEKQAEKAAKAAHNKEQELMAKVGTLLMENDWLKKKYTDVLGYEPQTKHGVRR